MTSRTPQRTMVALTAFLCGCAAPRTQRGESPSLAPPTRAASSERLELGERPPPLHRELLPIDFATAVHAAAADAVQVARARQRVESARGGYEASVGALFPVLAPGVAFDKIDGRVRGIEGPLLAADFESLAPAALLRLALNPGRAYYDIVASRRIVEAAEHAERQALQDALRSGAVLYYELALAQARLSASRRALNESEELVRIAAARARSGTGLESQRLAAEASLARRQQEVLGALAGFYDKSVELCLALRLDSTVTLAPSDAQLEPRELVDPALDLDELLAVAVEWREDLAEVRALLGAEHAARSGARWSAFGPSVDLSYTYGGIRSRTPTQDFKLSRQERLSASAGWSLSLASPGRLRSATASTLAAQIDAERMLEVVRAQVVRAQRESLLQAGRLPLAQRELAAARESVRQAEAASRVGAALALEALRAAEELDRARVRWTEAVVRYNQAQVELLAAVGVLDDPSLLAAPPAADEAELESGPGRAAAQEH